MNRNGLDVLGRLRKVEITAMQQASGLQVFGLKWPCGNELDYMTLDEALQEKVLDVAEIDEGGRVPAIKVANKSRRLVFMMAGELLVGCKQDRVLDASMMVPTESEMRIPVSCVEAGRWVYQSRKFRSGDTSSPSFLRMMMSRQSSAHYRRYGRPGSDQTVVWAEIARKMQSMGSSSLSGALQDVYKDYGKKLDEVLGRLSAPGGCHGAAFAIGGKIVGVDLFDKPATLLKLWSKLLKSYAIDALEDPKGKTSPVQAESVSGWLKAASSAKQEWFDSPGVGKDVRIEGRQLAGATLVVGEHSVHLELFREEGIED